MSRGRFSIPDLDALESPLLSPSSLTGLGGVRGSAIAEKIFNDPHSWDDNSGDEADYPEDIESDTLLWFAEEIEKLKLQSAGIGNGDRRETKDIDLVPKRDGNGGWKDIARRGSVRPISLAGLFEHSNDDFSKEIQQHLAKIISPKSSLASPFTSPSMNTPSTADSISTPLTSSTATEISPSVYSASALSFLEYYGISPESPLLDPRRLSRKRTRRRSKDKSKPAQVSSTETAPPSTPPRPAPPPGLEVPFKYPSSLGSWPPLPNSNGLDQSSPSSAPHSRKSSHSQEPAISGSDSSPRSRPLPIATGSPPRSTQETTLSGSPFRVRRLPSIPSEPQPLDQDCSRQATPPPHMSVPASAFLSPSNSSSSLTSFSLASAASQISMSLRTPSTARSPLGVPLGPRTRARSSDNVRPMHTIQPC